MKKKNSCPETHSLEELIIHAGDLGLEHGMMINEMLDAAEALGISKVRGNEEELWGIVGLLRMAIKVSKQTTEKMDS